MSLGEFENTNPNGRIAALRNEPNLMVAGSLAKTNSDDEFKSARPDAIERV